MTILVINFLFQPYYSTFTTLFLGFNKEKSYHSYLHFYYSQAKSNNQQT